jgi:hypothetical protein
MTNLSLDKRFLKSKLMQTKSLEVKMRTKSEWFFFFVLSVVLTVNCAKKPEWHEYVSKEGRFSVMVPGRVETGKETIDRDDSDKYEFYHFLAQERQRYSDQAYIVLYIDMKPEDDSTFIQWFWGVAFRTIQKNAYGEISESDISVDGHKGKEYVYKDAGGGYHARIFQVQRRVYVIIAAMTHGSTDQDHIFRFLDSFKITG